MRQEERERRVCNNLDNTGSWFCWKNTVGAHEHIHACFSPHAREPRHQLQHKRSHTRGLQAFTHTWNTRESAAAHLQGKRLLYQVIVGLDDGGQQVEAVCRSTTRCCRRHVARGTVAPHLGENHTRQRARASEGGVNAERA
jgi:hypothetical protein